MKGQWDALLNVTHFPPHWRYVMTRYGQAARPHPRATTSCLFGNYFFRVNDSHILSNIYIYKITHCKDYKFRMSTTRILMFSLVNSICKSELQRLHSEKVSECMKKL